MRKCKFYSLILVGTSKKPVAKEWNGYTDGRYNYYKNGLWFVIEPTTGLSMAYGDTRQEAAEKITPALIEQANKAVTGDLIDRFNKAVHKLQEEV